MATATKTPRLLAAAKEFNIGKETLLEFLTGKGFEINASNPNTKLTEEMYDALQGEFAQDRLAKRKSEEIALPKGSLIDKKKEEPEIVPQKAEEIPAPPVVEKKEVIEKKEEEIVPEKEEVPVVKEKEEEPVKEVPQPIAEEIAQPEPVAEEKTQEPEVEEVVAKEDNAPEVAGTEEQEATGNKVDIKAPKLERPNVLGKINLDEMNLSSRPKKGAAKKKATKEEPKEEPVKKARAPKAEAQPEAPAKQENPKPVEAKPAAIVPPKETPKEEESDKPEHIEMKAPKLEGPKIIGRITLPVANTSSESKEKRNRKRIPLQKKPETFKPDQRPGAQRGDRPDRGGQRFGQAGGGQHQGGGGAKFDRSRSNDRRGPNRNAPQTQQQQEIDAKAIQEKIRQTQAKLAGNSRQKNHKSKYRRNKREEMAEKRAAEESGSDNIIQLTEFISVSELANLLDVSFADVISKCMGLGIMVSINQRLDAEVIELVAGEFGYEVEFINLEQSTEEEEDEIDEDEEVVPRAPIVTIMGHVDHGKTSLLDYIRSANVVAGEAGGITQHIGAYRVTIADGKMITFLDTPGHEAFTAMRARGAKVADIAIIVVAADDAIMPQTKEAISHAQAANLPMVFAINKIDKEGANPEKIKEQLAGMNILVEDWGGKFQSQEISAKKGINIDLLLEKVALEAELLELKANPDRIASGSVIEASLDKGRGYQATILVQNGTLEQGDMIVCGQYYGKIKAMFNERGQRVQEAGPSAPVQVLGLNGAPQAGEKFKVYAEENEAKEIANRRSQILREQGIRTRKHITLDEIGRRLALGNFKELAVIIKGDFDGSVEALSDSLQKLSTEEVAVNVVHKGVGQITESDVLLATASDAIIIGFQVRPSTQASRLAEQENIEIRTYSIIYDAIEEVKSAMEGLLEPKVERKTVANVEIREVFKISGIGTIAGCYVLDGKIARNTKVNLVRDGIVVYNGELASLKRFKDDVKEVAAGYECGMSIKNYNDIRVGDIIEGYDEVEVKRTL
ncbi:MAG TPA: translation initiation factor IF-2 [Flavipsychrobacter sp.]|nr:translation initiation factor IF-2 [Flavipsychrobacter sp.]